MKDLLKKRLGFIEDEVMDTENYYGHKVCGQCSWFDEGTSSSLPHCTFREWLRGLGKEPGKDDGREPEQELFYQSNACPQWYD